MLFLFQAQSPLPAQGIGSEPPAGSWRGARSGRAGASESTAHPPARDRGECFPSACRVAPELGALSREEAADHLAESRVRYPVRGMRLHREEAAQELVFALGAGVEAGEPVPDAVLDQAVVADLEVQAAVLLGAAPVAAEEEGVAAREAVGAGHVAPAAPREHQEGPIGKRRRRRDEERKGQRGVAPFAVVGGAVQRVVRAPVGLGGGAAVEGSRSRPGPPPRPGARAGSPCAAFEVSASR